MRFKWMVVLQDAKNILAFRCNGAMRYHKSSNGHTQVTGEITVVNRIAFPCASTSQHLMAKGSIIRAYFSRL